MSGVAEAFRGVPPLLDGRREDQRPPRAAHAPQLRDDVAAHVAAFVDGDDHVRRHQRAHGGQLAHRGAADHGVEGVAERGTVAPLRCRGEPEDARVGVVREDGLHRGRLASVALVEHHEGRRRTRAASVERTQAAHLDPVPGLRLRPRRDDAAALPRCSQTRRRVAYQAVEVCREDDGARLLAENLRRRVSLAAPRAELHADCTRSAVPRRAHFGAQLRLVGFSHRRTVTAARATSAGAMLRALAHTARRSTPLRGALRSAASSHSSAARRLLRRAFTAARLAPWAPSLQARRQA